ncbi:hypothetical protein E5K02_03590 [Hymenobacter metallicola]|uniref:Uncharacterized protein n=1 Tax=Hymenobacter metallicola TaxID=2563114 RepID=A0A4Z0QGV5_9BACT|nr:hypothetical protein [Hymenobacter metallicola]TGE28559.1 hypothetical protein E5K02_03590 [Hymenobacter metallicola]
MIEDGFSQMQTLKTVDSSTADSLLKSRGEVGLNNVFAFLGVKLEGEGSKHKKDASESTSELQKVHTPNSLFAKMYNALDQKGVIRKESLLDSGSGDFVLFKSKLQKNPVIDNLESYFSLFRLAFGFTDSGQQTKQQKADGQANKKVLEQFESLIKQLKSEGSLDLVGESVGNEQFKAVLTIDRDYLNDPSLSDIADGEFCVLGKAIRVIKEDNNQGINLLRKTSLSKFSDAMLKQMFSGFQNMDEHGLKNVEFMTEVRGPVLQVIPIAIFA